MYSEPTFAPPPSTPDLTAALEQDLRSSSPHGDRRVTRLERQPSAHATSAALEELLVEFDDGSELAVLFKNVGPDALLPAARSVKPSLVLDPEREIALYRDVLVTARDGTAACYAAISDASHGRYWLFLERVEGVELYQVGEIEVWTDVARYLAQFHERHPETPGGSPRKADHLLRYDAAFHRGWMARALEFTEALAPGVRDDLSRVSDRHDQLLSRLDRLPRALIHGDFYASNILVGPAGPRRRIYPVDWEMAGIGPALLDLAALTSGRWNDEERAQIVSGYHEGLAVDCRPSLEELLASLDWCRLQLAIQWLGWAPNWRPPPSRHTIGPARPAA